MAYNGPERRASHWELSERLALVEHKVTSLEKDTAEIMVLLQEIKDINLRTKTFIGALTFIISGLWLVVSTFKETIIYMLTGKG